MHMLQNECIFCVYLVSVKTIYMIDSDRHYLKSWSDLRVFSNRRSFQILRSMVDLLVRVRVRAYVSDVSGHRFDKVRNSHIFEIGRQFENWKKDIDLRIGH